MGPQDDHNDGQKDGSEATGFDRFVHDVLPSFMSEEYEKGYENGRNNPSEGDEED